MTVPSFLEPRGLQLLIFGGKGGVGKTACSTATALEWARRSPESSFLLVSTDPAHSLYDSLGDLSPPGNLKVCELDAREYLSKFKQQHSQKLRQIASRGTFLDNDEITRFLDLSLPGLDELMAFLEVSAWVESRSYDGIIMDTAPSGHTLRLLAMPEFLRKWLAMLETLLAKHHYMKWVFSHSKEREDLDDFLEELSHSVKRMEGLLQDPLRCRFVPVMLAEAMSIREAVAIVKEVARLKLPLTEIVVNRLYPNNACSVCGDERLRQTRELRKLFRDSRWSRFVLWGVPLYPDEVRGRKSLALFWVQAMRISEPPAGSETLRSLAPEVEGAATELPLESTFTIFAGKGGVGKTTLACATALQLARNGSGKSVLLFSTGPAHGLSSCLQIPIDSRPKEVIPGLTAMEIDSEAEFDVLKKQYAGDIKRFLEAASSNFDLTFDREVLERILDLSPPGLDEVMALTRVMALLASGRYDLLVLDSASTGHLIRLLELPEIIDQWLKVFFDLFLKYHQIFRLTKFSQELVTMSKNLKRLRSLLTNPATTTLYAVSIPTEMAFEETLDLVAACDRLRVSVPGLFLNLVTPPGDCDLCSALHRRESLVRTKLQQWFSSRSVSVVYRRGEVRGLSRLEELGKALYPSPPVESRAYVS